MDRFEVFMVVMLTVFVGFMGYMAWHQTKMDDARLVIEQKMAERMR